MVSIVEDQDKEEVRKELEKSIGTTKKLLHLLGFWPESDGSYDYRRMWFVVSQGIFGIYITGIDVVMAYPNIVLVTKYSCFFFAMILACSKMFNFVYYRHKISDLINIMKDEFWTVEGEEEIRIIRNYANQGKIMSIANSYMVFITGFLFTTLPLISMALIKHQIKPGSNETVPRLFPFEVYPPVEMDVTKSPNYEILYVIEIFAIIFGLFLIASFDNIFAVFVMHTSGQFKVLQCSMRKLGYVDNNKIIDDNIDRLTNFTEGNIYNQNISSHTESRIEQILHNQLISCVEKHQKLIWFANQIEELFTITIMLQFLISSLFICLCGFQITTLEGGVVGLPVFVCYFITAMIQLYMYCYAGNELLTTSGDVSTAAYFSEWYECSRRFRSTVQQIIMRGQDAQVLTANKFSNVTLESFSAILSTAGSYFTLLTTMHEDDE